MEVLPVNHMHAEVNFTEFNVTTEFSNESFWDVPTFPPLTLTAQVTKTFAYTVLLFISIFGNASILWSVYIDPRLKTTTNFLIANMALGDLLLTFDMVFTMVKIIRDSESWVIQGEVGLALCKLLQYLSDVSFGVAMYSCLFIALDRYYAVAKPLKGNFTKTKLKYVVAFIWGFSAVISTPVLYSFKTVYNEDQQLHCIEDWLSHSTLTTAILEAHFVLTSVIMTFVPVAIVICLYVMVVVAMYQHPIPSTAHVARRRKQNQKVLKMAVSIVVLFCTSWLFVEILSLLYKYSTILDDAMTLKAINDLYFAAVFIILSSTTHQFFIFLVFVDSYRENFKKILMGCFRCGKKTLILNSSNSTSVRSFH